MTGVLCTVADLPLKTEELATDFDDPSEWVVLRGQACGEHSVWTDEAPDDYDPEVEAELGHEDADAPVDGFYQIGHIGWTAKCFDGDPQFVREYSDMGAGKIDKRLLNLLIVHESLLTDEALEAAADSTKHAEQVVDGGEGA